MTTTSAKPIIFISYSHRDEPGRPGPDEVPWLTFVQSFLAPVVKVGIFHMWADPHLRGSDVLDPAIMEKLISCDIFVLLTSRYSLASTYVVETELGTIRRRQASGADVRIFPIVLSPVPKAALTQLGDLVLRPKDGMPLSLMTKNDRDVSMAEIADDIAAVAQEIAAKRASQAASAAKRVSDLTSSFLTRDGSSALDVNRLPDTPYERLVGRESELKSLDDAWTDPKTNIISLVAEGGAGKSALVNEWLRRFQADNYRGAQAVLGWSFYSQGTKERATSAEEFLNWALDKLGIKVETTSSTAKGEAIAEALTRRRVLLMLDGVEPLQHGPGPQIGQLKDLGLRALLRRFAATPPAEHHGLIVLSSRLSIADIARWRDNGAPVVDVEQLSDDAGAALLRDNGVWGTDNDLKTAAHDFGGHPLALGLLASLLKETQNGDVRRRDHIRAYLADRQNPRHDHARRVMESYENEWLSGQPMLLAIMQMVGLFDRPASDDCLKALRAGPSINGLTDRIVGSPDTEWQRAVARLREVRLLAPQDLAAPDALDAHALVREWFGERLKETNKAAWKAAHGRLYEHLRDTTREGVIPTLEDLAPLYQAIAHGCCAERYQETLEKIYLDRICGRDADGRLKYHSTFQLGAIGSDLAAISWFYDKPYETPVASLSEKQQSLVLSDAAFSLRAQGRFGEALSAERAGLRMDEESEDWTNASISAANLSDAEALVGEVAAALATAERSVANANRSGDDFQIIIRLATRADVLHTAGRRAEAARLFADAEQLQVRKQPAFPLLYSWQGYRYCELLLAEGRYTVARDRARRTVQWTKSHGRLMDFALDTLTDGRAQLGLTLTGGGEPATARSDGARNARAQLNRAMDDLRTAGSSEFISRGLLARTVFRRDVGDWESAARDLDEVEEIAEPGPMKLFLCDVALERARLAFAKIEAFAPLNGMLEKDNPPKPMMPSAEEIAQLKDEADKQLKIAADYIEKCGYHRRDEELAELQAVLRGARTFASLPPRV